MRMFQRRFVDKLEFKILTGELWIRRSGHRPAVPLSDFGPVFMGWLTLMTVLNLS